MDERYGNRENGQKYKYNLYFRRKNRRKNRTHTVFNFSAMIRVLIHQKRASINVTFMTSNVFELVLMKTTPVASSIVHVFQKKIKVHLEPQTRN